MNHPDMYRLSTQQLVSLDKHQEMIDNALQWQRLPAAEDKAQKPGAAKKFLLAWVWAASANLLSGR